METTTLLSLEEVNQLCLSEEERGRVLAFFNDRNADLDKLNLINTEKTERMVHVLPIETVVREDKEIKLFTRDELQKGAPETMDGYWQVPRVVE